jgi:hypothetical protein
MQRLQHTQQSNASCQQVDRILAHMQGVIPNWVNLPVMLPTSPVCETFEAFNATVAAAALDTSHACG